jgi:hypothetical protein
LRDRHEDFIARGVDVTVIGMGATQTAKRFKEHEHLPFRVLVDKKRVSYELLGHERGSVSNVMGPKVWRRGLESLVRHGQGLPKEDPYQLGGVAVIAAGGTLKLVHRSATSADNLPVDDLLEALR